MNDRQLDMVLGYLNEGIEIDREEYINESDNKLSIKKNEKYIRNFINKSLKDFYNKEKNNFKSNSNYDWRRSIKGQPFIQGKFNYISSNSARIILSYPGDPSMDDVLFFESDFVKYLNNQNDKLLQNFKFISEDTPNIIIKIK